MTSDNSKTTKTALPEEIVTDIVSRLSVKPVFQLQCLSKNFSSITKNPSFVAAHLIQSARLRPSLIVNKGHDVYLIRSDGLDSETTVDKVPIHKSIDSTNASKKLRIVGSCNGLVVVYIHVTSIPAFNDVCFLWNPLINKCDHLPSPGRTLEGNLELATWGFGYCIESNVYKIIRIAYFVSYCFTNSKLLVEILTYGVDCAWRKLDFRKVSKMCNSLKILTNHGITVKGVVYWKPTYDKKNDNKILTFDLEKEKFSWISCPASVEAQIMEFKGSLALCMNSEINGNKYDIWVLKNVISQADDDDDDDVSHTVNESFWEKITTTEFLSSMPIRCLNDRQLFLLNFVRYDVFSCSLYDLRCKEVKEIPQVKSGSRFDVFSFVESIVPLPALGFDSEYDTRIYAFTDEDTYFWLSEAQEKTIGANLPNQDDDDIPRMMRMQMHLNN